MKILILTSSFSLSNSDSSFVHEFAKSLMNEDFEVIILAPHSYEAKKFEIMDNIKVYRFSYFYPYSFQKIAYGGGIPYNIKNSIIAKIQIPFFLLSELISTIKVIKKENIDLINSHWCIPQGLVGSIIKKIYKIPHISTIHSSEVTFIKKIPFGGKFAEFTLLNSNFIVSASFHRMDEILSFSSLSNLNLIKDRIHIVPMGVDLDLFKNKINKNELKLKYGFYSEFIVLFIGILTEVKGCKYLIDSFEEIVAKRKDVKLVIVGNGPLEKNLNQQVSSLNLEKYVRFEGFVKNNKISDYYFISDVVVVPSIVDSSGFEEGFPVVIMEALAAGKPIISTKIKGVMEAIQDGYNGILVNQKNSREIAHSILKLLDDNIFRNKISKNSLESGKKYDWSVITYEYKKMIQEAIKHD